MLSDKNRFENNDFMVADKLLSGLKEINNFKSDSIDMVYSLNIENVADFFKLKMLPKILRYLAKGEYRLSSKGQRKAIKILEKNKVNPVILLSWVMNFCFDLLLSEAMEYTDAHGKLNATDMLIKLVNEKGFNSKIRIEDLIRYQDNEMQYFISEILVPIERKLLTKERIATLEEYEKSIDPLRSEKDYEQTPEKAYKLIHESVNLLMETGQLGVYGIEENRKQYRSLWNDNFFQTKEEFYNAFDAQLLSMAVSIHLAKMTEERKLEKLEISNIDNLTHIREYKKFYDNQELVDKKKECMDYLGLTADSLNIVSSPAIIRVIK